ncbi:MAG: hypothetical protein AB1668_04975 [Nanoarchaeota archaeon]
METDTEYKEQEELYRRIVNQYGRGCIVINDTGTSFELTNTTLQNREHIYVTIELPLVIKEGATSQVNMVACLADFSDTQRFRLNDGGEDEDYRDGLESMMGTLKRFKRFRDILYAPKKINEFSDHARSGYTGESVRLAWTPDGPEYSYTIPTETECDLIYLVTDFRLDDNCIFNLHENGRGKWQLSDLYLERNR